MKIYSKFVDRLIFLNLEDEKERESIRELLDYLWNRRMDESCTHCDSSIDQIDCFAVIEL
jgi:hypothetical protein